MQVPCHEVPLLQASLPNSFLQLVDLIVLDLPKLRAKAVVWQPTLHRPICGQEGILVSIELRLSSNHGSLCCCPASLCALEDSLNDTGPSCGIALLGGVEAPRHVHCRPPVVPLVIFLQLKIILTCTGWVRGLRLRAWLGPVSARDQH